MANKASGNLYFIDTAGQSIDIRNVRVLGIVVHCTHASNAASIALATNDTNASYPTILSFEVPAASDYAHLDFSNSPLTFPMGIRVKTLSNAEITLILDKTTN